MMPSKAHVIHAVMPRMGVPVTTVMLSVSTHKLELGTFDGMIAMPTAKNVAKYMRSATHPIYMTGWVAAGVC